MKRRRTWPTWTAWVTIFILLMGSAEAFGGALFPLMYVLFLAWFLWRADRETGRGSRTIRRASRKRQPK